MITFIIEEGAAIQQSVTSNLYVKKYLEKIEDNIIIIVNQKLSSQSDIEKFNQYIQQISKIKNRFSILNTIQNGVTPIWIAAQRNNTVFVKHLIESGASIEIESYVPELGGNLNVLDWAIYHNNKEMVKNIVEDGHAEVTERTVKLVHLLQSRNNDEDYNKVIEYLESKQR